MSKSTMKKVISFVLVTVMVFGLTTPTQSDAAGNKNKNVKNVIMMIPDGMSVGATTLARYMLNEKGDVPLVLDQYVTAMVKTRWANGPITDSAPAATALATGNKSVSGALGINDSLLPRASILEAAQLKGKATGLVATSEFMHATPAAYTSHEMKRSNYASIAEQMLNQDLDVVLGTGATKVETKVLDITAIARSKGYTLVDDRPELLDTKASRVWGNFSATIGDTNNMSYDIDRNREKEPSLAEMTTKAINILNKDKDGFFLMVEGSKIDWAAHANDTVGIVNDTLAFDQAFKAAVEFAKEDGNTIVVAVTDHGNSGITIGNTYASPSYDKDIFSLLAPIKVATKTAEGAMTLVDAFKTDYSLNQALNAYGIDPTDPAIATEIAAFKANPSVATLVKTMNKKSAIGYTTGGHTGEDVPLYIYAPKNVVLPHGVIDNTSVATYLAERMGVNLNAATSTLFVDVTQMGTMDTSSNIFTFINTNGKVITVKANQSVATVDGKAFDLGGQVAVFVNGKFFVPRILVNEVKKSNADNK